MKYRSLTINISVMNRIKVRAVGVTTAAIASVMGIAMPAFAAPLPTASGDVGYTAYGLQRDAKFTAQPDSHTCTTRWDVAGNYDLAFNLTGDSGQAVYSAKIKQDGKQLSGTATYPAGGTTQYAWKITSGSVNGDNVNFTAKYTVGSDALNPQTKMNVTGTIASDGTLSGTWSDNYQGGSRTGQFVTTSGAATQKLVGCDGDGNFKYSDADGNNYKVNVRFVNANGNDVWFAGPVKSGNVGAGQWLLAEVHNGGTHGSGDTISGSFVTKSVAKLAVAQMTNPVDGPFAVTSGDIAIH